MEAAARPEPLVRKIFQYWDSPQVPDALQEVMASWTDIPGWEYRRLDRRGALSWLQEAFDREHVRAFRLANTAAEEADFLRLCLLDAEGGLHVDSDAKRITTPDALLEGSRGAVVFREPYGALSNTVLYAPPQHRLVTPMRDMALRSLLARENDPTWAKTGSGLITRGVATLIMSEGAEPARSLTIPPQRHMRRHLKPNIPMPHKVVNRHRNAARSRVPEQVRRALDLFATEQADP
jgi:hypothetical protein